LTRTAFAAAVAYACVGCAATHGPTRAAHASPEGARATAKAANPALSAQFRLLEASLQRELDQVRRLRFVGMDDGPVPEFLVRTVEGKEYDSSALVGSRPFLVVFFATWCDSCTPKLEALRRSLDEEPMLLIPVSVDGPETWQGVEGYLRARGLALPVVRGQDQPQFVMSYNPFNSVPTVVIVGRNGGLVDYQMGWVPEEDARLPDSLKLARVIGPLGPRHD
jgi:hypothetical protein